MKGILKNKNVKSMLIPFWDWQMTFFKPKTSLYDIINAASWSIVVSINKKGKTLRPLVFLWGRQGALSTLAVAFDHIDDICWLICF